ncbi:MAG: hypothetical protein EPN79_15805 [Burkholderiaceae bacterium]|nr:MAG: hypothetical protein EPN79_15805 [Burkholderiaceae bacterium]
MKCFAALLLMLGLGLFSGRAAACCGDGPIAAQGAITAGTSVSSTISTATSTVTTWLQQIDNSIQTGFGKLYGEMAKQTAQQRIIQEGMVAAETQLYMEKARADAAVRYQVSPRVCFETAGGAAVATASAETAQNVDDLNRNEATRTLFTANTAADVHDMIQSHMDKYCSAEDAALGRCTAVSADMQNADVRVDTLLSHSSLTPDQVDAAQQLQRNLVNPLPTQNLPKGLENTSAGRMFIAGQYIEQAGLSVAANSVNQAIAVRTPVQGLGSSAMMNTPDISELGLMEAQVNGRFESPEWYTMLAGMSQDNLLREMNKQMALKLWMDLKAFKQQERQEAALATILALDVRRDSEQNLKEARADAVRSQ